MSDILNIKNLNKSYSDFKLENVSINIPKGCVMGFIGENGAGKTTTIKAILNLIKFDSGEITVFGKDNKKFEKEIKSKIGVVFDEGGFHDNLNIAHISKIMSKIYKTWDNDLFYNYMRKFEIPDKKVVKDFSRGMKMKLNIAAALSHHPQLLILDEATSGLDPVVREEILDIFLDFIQDEEKSIFISSHITSDLDKIADYITFIHNGNIIFSRAKDELVDDMGIVRCKIEFFNKINKENIIRYRKNDFGYEILVKNKKLINTDENNIILDNADIEQIMLYYIRGEKI